MGLARGPERDIDAKYQMYGPTFLIHSVSSLARLASAQLQKSVCLYCGQVGWILGIITQFGIETEPIITPSDKS